MKVLFLVPYPKACVPSQRLKFEQYFDYFRDNGMEIIFKPFYSHFIYEYFYGKGSLIKCVAVLLGSVRRIFHLWPMLMCDVVFLHLEAVPFGWPLFEWLLFNVFRKPVIYDIDDMIHMANNRGRSGLYEIIRNRNKSKYIARRSQCIIVVTEELKKIYSQINSNITYIPPTIDVKKYLQKEYNIYGNTISKPVCIGWSGSKTTLQYFASIEPVLKRIHEKYKNDIKFQVIGDKSFKFNSLPVEAKDWKLETEVSDLQEFDIGLYPLPKNYWVLGKGGLKALQYMGVGVPVIATNVGMCSLFIKNGVNGFLADSFNEWEETLSGLIESPQLRESVGKAGRAMVVSHFSVEVHSKTYLDIFEKIQHEKVSQFCENK